MAKKRKNKKSLKKYYEQLKHDILPSKVNKSDLSTSTPNGLITNKDSDIIVDSENDFLNFDNARGGEQKIQQWRNLVARYMDCRIALNELVNEAIIFSDDVNELVMKPAFKKNADIPINIQERLLERWERIYEIAKLDVKLPEYFEDFYINGMQIAESVYDNNAMSDGVQDILMVDVKSMIKKLDKDKKKIYWISRNVDDKEENRMYEDQISIATSGMWDASNKMYLSFLNYAVVPLNKLDSIETSVISYCLSRSMEKIVYYIDTGKLKESKKKAKVREIANSLRTKSRYDKRTGSVTNTPSKIQLSRELFIATSGGEKSTTVENISADRFDLGDLQSLTWYQNKVYDSLFVSKLRMDKEATYHFDNPSEIEREEINFFKFVTKQRKLYIPIWKDILLKDAISANIIPADKFNYYSRAISFVWNNNNNYAELRRLNQMSTHLDMIDKIADYVKKEDGELELFDTKFVYNEILGWDDVKIEEMKKRLNGVKVDDESDEEQDDKKNYKSADVGGRETDTDQDDDQDDEESSEGLLAKMNSTLSEENKLVDLPVVKIDLDNIDLCIDKMEENSYLHIPGAGSWVLKNGELVEITG